MKNILLVNDDENFVVEKMNIFNKVFEFVHDKKTGKNYFNQFILSELFGINRKTVSYHLNKYLKNNTKNAKNIGINRIKLEIENAKRKQSFYDFNCVSYLAFRINTPEAIEIQNQISSILDTMFNVAVGKDSINSNKDWLKNQCEVKAFQAAKYKGASNLLYEGGLESDAKKMWGKYKKLKAESLHYKELYVDYDRIDRIVANERNCNSKQLKLI